MPRKTAESTVKHHDGGVGSVVANHRGGGESSVVVTTLLKLPYVVLFQIQYVQSVITARMVLVYIH